MSGYATNTDIMHALDDLRRHINGRLDDHEKRITLLEPVKPQVDRLTEHVSDIGRTVTVILERLDGTEKVMSEALRNAAKDLTSQLAATVRHELTGLREEVASLREELQARPCFQSGNCEVRDA
jgi:predicted  nucleic acid-binding Zn-ribbon protein